MWWKELRLKQKIKNCETCESSAWFTYSTSKIAEYQQDDGEGETNVRAWTENGKARVVREEGKRGVPLHFTATAVISLQPSIFTARQVWNTFEMVSCEIARTHQHYPSSMPTKNKKQKKRGHTYVSILVVSYWEPLEESLLRSFTLFHCEFERAKNAQSGES